MFQNKSLKIYIAGPYSAKIEGQKVNNTNVAIDAGIALFSKGHSPYIPHLTHYVDKRANEMGILFEWKDYIRWDLTWLNLCDALLYLGSSKGADLELQVAKETGKQIFYSLDEVPDVSKEERVTSEFA